MTVAVVKLGVGNTASVMFALERIGADAVLTEDAAVIESAERVILPGVGAAAHAMAAIERKGLRRTLATFARPLLGICLGQQLLFESSEEGDAAGLSVLPGRVRRLPASKQSPAPHMGWSRLLLERDHAVLEGIDQGAYVYFVHSYVCPVGPETVASAVYGAPFPAIVARGNMIGCQFHPERSSVAGARILQNFLALPC